MFGNKEGFAGLVQQLFKETKGELPRGLGPRTGPSAQSLSRQFLWGRAASHSTFLCMPACVCVVSSAPVLTRGPTELCQPQLSRTSLSSTAEAELSLRTPFHTPEKGDLPGSAGVRRPLADSGAEARRQLCSLGPA